MEPRHLGAEPADEVPVVEPVFRPPHRFRAGREIDRRIGGENAIEPVHGSVGSLRGQLECETGAQRKPGEGDGRSGSSTRHPVDHGAQVVAAAGVIDTPGQSKPGTRPSEVHPDHADAQSHQPPGEADDVRRAGTTRKTMNQDGCGVCQTPSPRHRLQHAEPVAIFELDLMGRGLQP